MKTTENLIFDHIFTKNANISSVGPSVNYNASRLLRHRIYGLSGYMVNFCLVPNGMGFHTTRYPAYMVWIPDTWSIFRGCKGPWGAVSGSSRRPPRPRGPSGSSSRPPRPRSDRPRQRRGRDVSTFPARNIVAHVNSNAGDVMSGPEFLAL